MPRNSIVFFVLVVLIDSIGFGIILPVLPSLLQQLGAGDARHAVTLGGLLTFAYAAMQFVCAPIVGALSDRLPTSRRPRRARRISGSPAWRSASDSSSARSRAASSRASVRARRSPPPPGSQR